MKFGFIVSITEYERGWGCRPEGYFIFDTEETATKYIKSILAKRGTKVPDCYDDYNPIGYKPISEEIFNELSNSEEKRVWVKKL